jgi:peptidoglycan/xylan/chitin deacetylase (PgdA/CDA1 family)
VLLAALVAGAYTIVGYSLLVEPLPLWFILAYLAFYATVINLGVMFLNLGVFVDVVSRGPATSGAVALTFDDGPHPDHTRRVLDALDAVGAKATFFLIGRKVAAYPEVVADIARRGHEIGLHGYEHSYSFNMHEERRIMLDLEKTRDAVQRAAGVRSTMFRPPVGITSPRVRVAVRALDLDVIGWSTRAFDGAGRPSAEQATSRIAKGLEPGAIVLLHDAMERTDEAPATVEALPGILRALKDRGLRAVTVSELLERPSSLPRIVDGARIGHPASATALLEADVDVS